MVSKCLCIYFLLSIVFAQEYCQYGQSVYPWDPFRCSPFLANVDTKARADYAEIVKNRTVPWGEIKNEIVEWGKKNGIQADVTNFIEETTQYIKDLSVRVTKFLKEDIVAEEELYDLLLNDKITEEEKHQELNTFFGSTNPKLASLVSAYTELGKAGPPTAQRPAQRPIGYQPQDFSRMRIFNQYQIDLPQLPQGPAEYHQQNTVI